MNEAKFLAEHVDLLSNLLQAYKRETFIALNSRKRGLDLNLCLHCVELNEPGRQALITEAELLTKHADV